MIGFVLFYDFVSVNAINDTRLFWGKPLGPNVCTVAEQDNYHKSHSEKNGYAGPGIAW